MRKKQFVTTLPFREGGSDFVKLPRTSLQSNIEIRYDWDWTGTLTGIVQPFAVEKLAGFVTLDSKRADGGLPPECRMVHAQMFTLLHILENGNYPYRVDLTSSPGHATLLLKIPMVRMLHQEKQQAGSILSVAALSQHILRFNYGVLCAASWNDTAAFVGAVAVPVITGSVTVQVEEDEAINPAAYPSVNASFQYFQQDGATAGNSFSDIVLGSKEFQESLLIHAYTRDLTTGLETPADTVLNDLIKIKVGATTKYEVHAATLQADNLKRYKNLAAPPAGLYVYEFNPSGDMDRSSVYFGGYGDNVSLTMGNASAAALTVDSVGFRGLHVTSQATPKFREALHKRGQKLPSPNAA